MKTSIAISPFENNPEIKDLPCKLMVEIKISPIYWMPAASNKEEMLRGLSETKLQIMASHIAKHLSKKLNGMTLEELEAFYFKMMEEK